MAGEQLERSILESKERDELQAIAAAMSLKPAARTKKSDIIDLILDATGIKANGDDAGSAPISMSDVDVIAGYTSDGLVAKYGKLKLRMNSKPMSFATPRAMSV